MQSLLSSATSAPPHNSQTCLGGDPQPQLDSLANGLPSLPSGQNTLLELQQELNSLRAALSEAQYAANHDYLTGLLNRRAFEMKAGELLQQASDAERFALLWFDLDDFKSINDRAGHDAGDSTLQAFARILQQTSKRSALIARLGGDEFCLLENMAPDELERRCQLILKELATLPALGGTHITASIGVAIGGSGTRSLAELKQQADGALYIIKRRGGGGVELYGGAQAGPARSFQELQPEDLRRAISAEELRLFYQPKFAARTRRIEGVEALVRWEHPTQGLLLPKSFLPLTDQDNLIEGLTEWTIRQTALDRTQLRKLGHELTMAVNISGQLLCKPNFAVWLHTLSGGDAKGIGIEVTETEIIPDSDTAIRNLNDCAALGYKIAIDDYGAGLSSLSYLRQLPAHELKIDRSFISQLTKSHRDPLLVRSTIDLAHALDMTVTAEGVEAPAALALLTVMGCDTVQGFLLAEPMPLRKLADILAAAEKSAESKDALEAAVRRVR